ncbi:hypothetical protein T484DRAFT_1845263 [Baffinella frigidus]|nr:hypothetical protein T484DRAFT_1845263 [Cryptophyta sp. CCMP2293]
MGERLPAVDLGTGRTVAPSGPAACAACPAGSYFTSVRAPTCTACPAGSYAASSSSVLAVCLPCPAGSYSIAVGASTSTTCTRCLAGSYWSDASGACTSCPHFSSSVEGSGDITDCVCDAGHTFVGDACLSTAIVSFKATVQMSIAEFDAVRADYIAGVAVALGRAEADVRIVSVAVMATGKRRSRETSVATGRRVAGDRAVVETGVTVPAGEAESVARSITADLLNSALRSRGITLAEVTVYGADGTSTTTFSPET